MKERNIILDNMKAILIILVVIGHFGTSGSTLYNTVILFIFSFHMPLFMFVSGYLSKNPEKCRNKAVKEYLILFLAAQILWVIYKIVVCHDFYYVQNLLEPGYGLWYILAIFVYRIILKDLIRIKYILVFAVIGSVGIMAFLNVEHYFDLPRLVGFLIYFLIGYYVDEKMFYRIRKIPGYVAGIALFMIGISGYLLLDQEIINYQFVLDIFRHQATIYEFHSIFAGIVTYLLIIPISLIIGILVIAMIPKKKMWFTYIGEDTLTIYLSHAYIVVLYRDFFKYQIDNYGLKLFLLLLLPWMCILFFSSELYKDKFYFCKNKIEGFIYAD